MSITISYVHLRTLFEPPTNSCVLKLKASSGGLICIQRNKPAGIWQVPDIALCYDTHVDPIPDTATVCPFCSSPVDSTAFFCPSCGKNIKEKPLDTGIWTQLGIYTVSILLPPLFIGWTIKYLKSSDPAAKQIGIISLVVTIVAIGIAVWLSFALAESITQQVNQQLNQYQNLGL